MRRTRLAILFALLAMFGISGMAAAGNTLSVSLSCFNNGNFVAACSGYGTSGGTGTYVSYYWQFTDTLWGHPTYSYSWTSTDPWLVQECRIGGGVTVTLTVTDSLGETGTGTHSIYCSQWAD